VIYRIVMATWLASATAVFAAEEPSPSVRVKEQVLRMTEFFDTMLPGVLEEHNMTLHFRPKFSDLRDEEYMRFPLEIRYGIKKGWELSGGVTPFTPNPFNSGRDHRWGAGEVKFGTRHDIGRVLGFFDETTVGVETRAPLGNPPIEINDHYTHIKPFVAAAHTLQMWPSTTFYANVSYDRSVKLTTRGTPPPEVMRRHIIEVAPGILYKPSQLGYFTEYRFQHIGQPDDWHLRHEIRVGTIWDIPLARSEKWRLPGKWQLELGYHFSHEEGQKHGHGLLTRVNWRTSLREVLEHTNGNFWSFRR
jgi:hypothetical protein